MSGLLLQDLARRDVAYTDASRFDHASLHSPVSGGGVEGQGFVTCFFPLSLPLASLSLSPELESRRHKHRTSHMSQIRGLLLQDLARRDVAYMDAEGRRKTSSDVVQRERERGREREREREKESEREREKDREREGGREGASERGEGTLPTPMPRDDTRPPVTWYNPSTLSPTP